MSEPSPVYVIHSGDPLLLRRELDTIEKAVGDDPTGFNRAAFDGRSSSAADIIAAASTLPMMAKYRYVLVREIATMPAKELNALIPYLSDPNPKAVLVLTTSKVDGRMKFYQAAKKAKYLVVAKAPKDLSRFVKDEASRGQVPLSPAAARRLVEVVGDDVSRLASCVEQLGLFANGDEVTASHVDTLIATTREESVFALTDAIASGDRRGAQALVEKLIAQRQSAIGTIALLGRFARQVAIIAAGKRQGASEGSLAKAAGVPPFVVRKLSRVASRTSPSAIETATSTLLMADYALKGGMGHGKTLGRDLAERAMLANVVDDLCRALH